MRGGADVAGAGGGWAEKARRWVARGGGAGGRGERLDVPAAVRDRTQLERVGYLLHRQRLWQVLLVRKDEQQRLLERLCAPRLRSSAARRARSRRCAVAVCGSVRRRAAVCRGV